MGFFQCPVLRDLNGKGCDTTYLKRLFPNLRKFGLFLHGKSSEDAWEIFAIASEIAIICDIYNDCKVGCIFNEDLEKYKELYAEKHRIGRRRCLLNTALKRLSRAVPERCYLRPAQDGRV